MAAVVVLVGLVDAEELALVVRTELDDARVALEVGVGGVQAPVARVLRVERDGQQSLLSVRSDAAAQVDEHAPAWQHPHETALLDDDELARPGQGQRLHRRLETARDELELDHWPAREVVPRHSPLRPVAAAAGERHRRDSRQQAPHALAAVAAGSGTRRYGCSSTSPSSR